MKIIGYLLLVPIFIVFVNINFILFGHGFIHMNLVDEFNSFGVMMLIVVFSFIGLFLVFKSNERSK